MLLRESGNLNIIKKNTLTVTDSTSFNSLELKIAFFLLNRLTLIEPQLLKQGTQTGWYEHKFIL